MATASIKRSEVNRIMKEASGTYIAWLDQDDLAYPERLSMQVGSA